MSGVDKIDRLIINGPYKEPVKHWRYDQATKTFSIKDGRREAGYVIASERSRSYDDPGTFVPLPLVNKIRPRIKKWRESGYNGATSITRRLLEHWHGRELGALQPFFFCQLEAIETLMWIIEAPPADKVGIDIPSDGGEFIRYCSKMATGSGKTLVMSMLISWQVLNKASFPKDTRYSSNIFIVAPGLTVKNRLQVLDPATPENYYQKFSIVPPGLMSLMRHARIQITNWHNLQWDSEEQLAKRKSVDKRGALSDEAYVRQVMGDMAAAKNIIVINDEAHHAWRVPAEMKSKKPSDISRDELEEATKWVDGLDRINRARGIMTCFDFSATPFAPTGRKTTEDALFQWIVSDFGLNDAIESGLVKTPRVVVRDDGVHDIATYKSKFYQIYDEISDDLTTKAEPHIGLPDLLTAAYSILGYDWREAFREWQKAGVPTPPVMISVVNTTETAARIKFAFDKNNIMIEELCDPTKTIHIDSKKIKETDVELRRLVDTVGQVGEPGEQIRNVISVGMLTEGWDAKTVTHIMGLRAFTSQLLCEQVVGRGLRRTSYEINEHGLLDAEYVNVFGVPFSFLPHEGGELGGGARPTPPKIKIEPMRERVQYEISWPNVLRIDHRLNHKLTLDHSKLDDLEIKAIDNPTVADLAPILEGKPDYSKMSSIDLKNFASSLRLQTIIFKFATHLLPSIESEQKWSGGKHELFADLVTLVESVLKSDKVRINPKSQNDDPEKRNLYLRLSMEKIIRHVARALISQNATAYDILYDTSEPIRYTRDAGIWYTTKRCLPYKKTHMNLCVFDNSTWEEHAAKTLDADKNVAAWVKNDHIGFEISYLFSGVVRKYLPDFLIRFTNGDHMILEIKGLERDKDKEKWAYLDEWCKAVSATKRYGKWSWGVSKDPNELKDVIAKHTGG